AASSGTGSGAAVAGRCLSYYGGFHACGSGLGGEPTGQCDVYWILAVGGVFCRDGERGRGDGVYDACGCDAVGGLGSDVFGAAVDSFRPACAATLLSLRRGFCSEYGGGNCGRGSSDAGRRSATAC